MREGVFVDILPGIIFFVGGTKTCKNKISRCNWKGIFYELLRFSCNPNFATKRSLKIYSSQICYSVTVLRFVFLQQFIGIVSMHLLGHPSPALEPRRRCSTRPWRLGGMDTEFQNYCRKKMKKVIRRR